MVGFFGWLYTTFLFLIACSLIVGVFGLVANNGGTIRELKEARAKLAEAQGVLKQAESTLHDIRDMQAAINVSISTIESKLIVGVEVDKNLIIGVRGMADDYLAFKQSTNEAFGMISVVFNKLAEEIDRVKKSVPKAQEPVQVAPVAPAAPVEQEPVKLDKQVVKPQEYSIVKKRTKIHRCRCLIKKFCARR